MKRPAALVLAGSLALGAVALAGCSSSSGSTSTDAASSSTNSSASAMPGSDPGTWAPVEITQAANGTTIDLVVGQAAIFTDLPSDPGIVVESSDPAVVEASQAEGSGDVTAVAGLVAKGVGTATITAKYGDQAEDQGGASNVVMQFTVNVTEKTN